jgi:hypothetical protein
VKYTILSFPLKTVFFVSKNDKIFADIVIRQRNKNKKYKLNFLSENRALKNIQLGQCATPPA